MLHRKNITLGSIFLMMISGCNIQGNNQNSSLFTVGDNSVTEQMSSKSFDVLFYDHLHHREGKIAEIAKSGANTVLVYSLCYSPERFIDYLNKAQEQNLKVIFQVWQPKWKDNKRYQSRLQEEIRKQNKEK